jgi:drug/metabolite transporter (DMT)-like permease
MTWTLLKMNTQKLSAPRANLLLLLTAVIWGGGFVAQRLGMQHLGPFIFNGMRFLVGSLVLIPILLFRKKRSNTAGEISKKKIWLIGSAAGVLLFMGATFQQLGLVYTTAGKAGFITGLYVIIVPLLGMIWGDKTPWLTWFGAVLALIGLYLLSVTREFTLSLGDSYVLIGALFWALHVQFLARYSPKVNPIRLSFIQSLVTASFSFLVGFLAEDFSAQQIYDAVIPIFYAGVISIAIAYTLQVVAQRSTRPASAAIILSLESVFAVFWGWLLIGETLTGRLLLGCGLMLGGMILSQLRSQTPH